MDGSGSGTSKTGTRRTSPDQLLALVIRPEATHGVTQLTHPCSGYTVEETSDACLIGGLVISKYDAG